MSIKEKISNFFNVLGYWFSATSKQGGSPARIILLGMLLITPIFLIAATPWFIYISMSSANQDKYMWLGDMAWIWPVCFCGLFFIGIFVNMIYRSIKDH